MTLKANLNQTEKIGIVNYGAGNIFSLKAALDRLGLQYGMINTAEELNQFNRIIIPGVGHAGAAMSKLMNTGLLPAIKNYKKPVLGICVGMQLLTDYSEEGNAAMTGIIPLKTLRFDTLLSKKVPHIGWNKITINPNNKLFSDVPDESYFYFVHSYFIEYNPNFTVASCSYGNKFSATIQKNNFYGVQFHPEKSGELGEKILKNFANI
jgi:glutamine amidotransferase